MPLTVSTSYAFMLPVSTPPNAIIYGTGYLTIADLVIPTSSFLF
jgi:solute carrier family 13 (sodium-dependent dicarboxylate transporter), member 2/3/5